MALLVLSCLSGGDAPISTRSIPEPTIEIKNYCRLTELCEIETYPELQCLDADLEPLIDNCNHKCYICANFNQSSYILNNLCILEVENIACTYRCRGCRSINGQ